MANSYTSLGEFTRGRAAEVDKVIGQGHLTLLATDGASDFTISGDPANCSLSCVLQHIEAADKYPNCEVSPSYTDKLQVEEVHDGWKVSYHVRSDVSRVVEWQIIAHVESWSFLAQ